jgi:hypothetical protein
MHTSRFGARVHSGQGRGSEPTVLGAVAASVRVFYYYAYSIMGISALHTREP